MAKAIRLLATLLALLLPAPAGAERIISFDSDIRVIGDGSMRVTETIRVTVEGREVKRGILRDFPTTYTTHDGRTMRVGLEVLEVRRNGEPEPYRIEPLRNGNRIRIGQAHVLLPLEPQTYEITYRTDRQLGFFEDHDELYWNVTGNGWTMPIGQATARVHVLGNPPITAVDGFTGPQGARGRAWAETLRGPGFVELATTEPLKLWNGFTIVAAWPKGYVEAPDALDRLRWLARDYRLAAAALAGLLLVALYYLIAWLLVGRDPRPGTVVPLFHPPRGLTPAGARYVSRMGFDARTFAAALVGLAVKKRLRLTRTGASFEVERRDDASQPLAPSEQTLVTTLFDFRNSVRLVRENSATVGAAQSALRDCLEREYHKVTFWLNKGWTLVGIAISGLVVLVLIVVEPSAAASLGAAAVAAALVVVVRVAQTLTGYERRVGRAIVAIAAFPLLFMFVLMGETVRKAYYNELIASTTDVAVCYIFALGLLGLYFFFDHLLPATTLAGRRLLDELEGYKLYLGVAEKDRLAGLDPPEIAPELFIRHLPYAIALDVEKAWSSRFAAVLTAATIAREIAGAGDGYLDVDVPDSGDGGGSWGSADRLVEDLGDGLSKEVVAATIPPGTESGLGSGGGSDWSGGGSLGGGGGGGSGW